MNTESADRELLLVLVSMGVFLIFGLVVVGIFFRVWYKERGGGSRKRAGGEGSGGPPPE